MIAYIIQAGIILAAGWLLYSILLYRETFYRLNRYVLLISLLAAFLLPLIPIPATLSFKDSASVQQLFSADTLSSAINQEVTDIHQPSISGSTSAQIILILYWLGVAIFIINTIIQVVVLLYQRFRYPVIRHKDYNIVELSGQKAPFSFGKTIFINPSLYTWDTYEMILLHEREHIRQNHSIDLILAECMLALQWWNPFAWKMYQSVITNIEFLTDDTILEKHSVNKSAYQLNLLEVAVPNWSLKVANGYNQSLLKKRVAMMNQRRSNLHIIWKYLTYLPIWILLMAFMNDVLPENSSPIPETVTRVLPDEQSPVHEGTDDTGTIAQNLPATAQKNIFPVTPVQKAANDQHGNIDTVHAVSPEISVYETFTPSAIETADTIKAESPEKQAAPPQKSLSIEEYRRLQKAGITMPVIDSYKRIGLTDLSVDELIFLRKNDITAPVIESFQRLKYPYYSLNTVIFFRKNKITAPLVEGYMQVRYAPLDPESIVSLYNAGITPPIIEQYARIGYKNLPVATYIELRKNDITVPYIESFQRLGYNNISVETLLKLKKNKITAVQIESMIRSGYRLEELEQYLQKK